MAPVVAMTAAPAAPVAGTFHYKGTFHYVRAASVDGSNWRTSSYSKALGNCVEVGSLPAWSVSGTARTGMGRSSVRRIPGVASCATCGRAACL